MKEIDFLPQWYKAGRRRKVNYRRQYIVLVGIFVAMVVWSFAASYSVSVSEGHIQVLQNSLDASENVSEKYMNLECTLKGMKSREKIVTELTPQTTYSSIIAELSFLADDNIMLKKLLVQAEPYKKSSSGNASAVTFANRQDKKVDVMPVKNTRLKVIMMGLAADASNVAILMSNLEESAYFCQVVPGYSRNKKDRDVTVTEFEISCYVANYQEE